MSKRCDVCSIHLQDDYALQGHLAGKKHLKRLQEAQVLERSIVVSPLPKFIPQHTFIEFFQQYGSIKWHRFGPSYLIVEFCDRKSTEALISKTVFIRNIKLNIKKRIAHNRQRKSKQCNKEINLIDYDNIKHIFEEDSTFDDQLLRFLNVVQPTGYDMERKYDSICTQLDKIFKVIFPKCKTYKFGSTLTGLGFKKCDLDMYMDIGEPIDESKSASSNSWNTAKIFKEVKKIMYKMNYVFSNIRLIPKAKTPIITFDYVRAHVSCDLSFKSSLGIYNSNLIKYCISLDSRLKPLMMLIKYWVRHFQLSGPTKISSYALVLLIIFYLQQPSVNIIPPLMVIQNTSQPQIVNGWQVNFDENIVLPPIRNRKSIPELLQGFFFFYATFQFKSQIICPIDGMIHAQSEFKEIQNLPPCMNRYKTYIQDDENLKLNTDKPMCIQDPISLNHNVTANTQHFTLHAFIKYCALGFEICTVTSKNDYRDLLKTLFTTILEKKAIKGKLDVTNLTNQFRQTNETNSMETCMDAVETKNVTQSD